MTTTIHIGDSRAILPTLTANSVHCVITSPPYYGLRAYSDNPAEIGREQTPEQYIAAMVATFCEVRRVLRDDGCCWLNLGDSYASDSKWGGATGGKHAAGLHGNSGISRARRSTGAKDKDLLLIPHRVALALQADGWYLRSTLPWLKRNAMPESVTDRPTTAHEYVFLLTKSPRYWYDADAVRVTAVAGANGSTFTNGKTGAANGRGQGPRNDDSTTRNYRTTDPWFDSLDALIAEQRAYLAHLERIRERGGLLSDEASDPLALPVNPQPYSGAHFAVFPERLIEPLMRAGCPAECCPHCGAGWVRVVEKESNWQERKQNGAIGGTLTNGHNTTHEAGMSHDLGMGKRTILGTRPACDCPAAPPVPGVVLDPFFGSGTTGRVAERLNRDCIGIDLHDGYSELQAERLNGVQKELLL